MRYPRAPACAAVFLLLQVLSEEATGYQHSSSRKRRYVSFPEGSSLGMQIVLSKPFLDYSFPSAWNFVLEYTVSFVLPNTTARSLQRWSRPRDEHFFQAHRRERRHVYRQLEAILDTNGLNGSACLLRTICETKFLLRPGKSVWQDILHVLFRTPEGRDEVLAPGRYDEAASHQDCKPWTTSCPVSFLGVLLASAA